MYVAQRELKIVPRGEKAKPVIFKPGDVIPDFDNWDIHARRAHLNLEWVKKVEGVESKTPPPQKEAKISEVAAEKIKCDKCGKEFKSAKAAKTHSTLAHK